MPLFNKFYNKTICKILKVSPDENQSEGAPSTVGLINFF